MKSPHVSLVVPFFNEELVADEFLTRAFAALDALDGVSYELICVNDGSTDATWQMLRDWAERRPAIVAVNLFRNFGHQLAVSAGLELASGDRVVIIDADLQDPPELIGPMLALMDQGADVVYGQRVRRHGETLFKRLSAKAFYVALSRLSGHDIPQDTGDFRVISRQVKDLLVAMPETHRFLRGMVAWIGGRQVAFPYERDARFAGVTKYPLRRMLALATDAITGFSIAPLRFTVALAAVAVLIAMALAAHVAHGYLLGTTVSGWASLGMMIAFFSACQLLALGFIGEYLGRCFQEIKRRPLYQVREVLSRKESP